MLETSEDNHTSLLLFLTGCEQLPYGGFKEKIKVHFKADCSEGCGCYPTVSLCGMTLVLPMHIKNAFKKIIPDAIKASPGFGRL